MENDLNELKSRIYLISIPHEIDEPSDLEWDSTSVKKSYQCITVQ